MRFVDGNAAIRVFRKSFPTLISIAAILFAVYTFYYTRNINITFDVVSETNVLDINAPVQGLEIMFRGQDISEKGLNLRLLMLRVENTGYVNLLESDFDQDIDWGINVSGGDIIRTRIAGASSTYLEDNLNPRLVEVHTIAFDKIVFDKGMYFLNEILILHNKNEEPVISTFGKISGIGDMPVNRTWNERTKAKSRSSGVIVVISSAIALLALLILRFSYLAQQQQQKHVLSNLEAVAKLVKKMEVASPKGE